MNNNCPVCNKPGLPDYRVQETVCPQCNSDLKSYLLLNSFKKKLSRYVSACIAIVVVLSVITLTIHSRSVNKNGKILNENHSKLLIATDSINSLNKILNQYEVSRIEGSSPTKDNSFIYKVRSGDNLGKIAELFFGDYRLYTKLAMDNNLSQTDLITIGQSLTIKMPQ